MVVIKILNAQLVYCRNRSIGCTWEGLKRDLSEHSSSCSANNLPEWLKKNKDAQLDKSISNANLYLDDEVAERIEREAPEIDLLTRTYLKNKDLLQQHFDQKNSNTQFAQAAGKGKKKQEKNADKAASNANKALEDFLSIFDGGDIDVDKLLELNFDTDT